MRQKSAPGPASTRPGNSRKSFHETTSRGLAVLNSPVLNKGTAFLAEERKSLGLIGLLPPEISTLAVQVKRAYLQYEALPDSLNKNIYLTTLHDRNEVLFYRLYSEHLREMIPVLNDVAAGAALREYRHERRHRGVYLSIDHPESIEEAFVNLRTAPDDIDLILATDAEQVPGVGDWGIGGIEVSAGKLATYTAAGGIDPSRMIPVMLDVGTNRQSLLEDPTYIGNRHPRIRGPRYDAFIDAYVEAAMKLFPNALLQWENFALPNGRRILEKYSERFCISSEDIQSTGAIGLAAAISAARVCGTGLRGQRVVLFGTGTSGAAIVEQIQNAMVAEGLSPEDAAHRFWYVDQQGLLTSDDPDLADVVRRVKPTMLIGASTLPGCFTEEVVKDMAAQTERPIIFTLSYPQGRSEATPADLIAWTEGRALIATGGPFEPVTFRGVTYVIGQLNNAMLYPGLALGAIVSRARRLSHGMLAAAARAVSSLVAVRLPGASLLPHVDDLRSVAISVAVVVAEAAQAEGIARVRLDDVVQQVEDAMWRPEYLPLVAS